MMLRNIALLAAASVSTAGCLSTVTTPPFQDGTTASDELWYVHEWSLLGQLGVGPSKVYYCPPADSPGPKLCKRALMHDE